MRKLKYIYRAVVNGSRYTNAEAVKLCKHFEMTAKILAPLGSRFAFAHKEAATQCAYLTDICRARGIEEECICIGKIIP